MTSQSEAINNLITLCINPNDPHVLNWLVSAAHEYINQPKSMDYCLGLSAGKRGDKPANTKILLAARNQCIRGAVYEIFKRDGLPMRWKPSGELELTWTPAGEVSRLIRKFRSLPKHIRLNKQHKTQDPVELFILKAFMFHDDLPCSQQRISDIAQSNTSIDLGSIVEQ